MEREKLLSENEKGKILAFQEVLVSEIKRLKAVVHHFLADPCKQGTKIRGRRLL